MTYARSCLSFVTYDKKNGKTPSEHGERAKKGEGDSQGKSTCFKFRYFYDIYGNPCRIEEI